MNTTTQQQTKVRQDVSHREAVQMVLKQVRATKNRAYGVNLTKEDLMEILNQPGCESVNFYFGHDENGNNALIAVGADEAQANLAGKGGMINDTVIITNHIGAQSGIC
jgi:hypothetical protein